MDYTPGFFHFKLNQFDSTRTTQVNTTIAKQVALFVVFYSPVQMLGDLPENLEKYPELVRYIVDIPLDWEETIVLDAAPGDQVVYARKAKDGKTWYVAGISDEQSRDIDLDFSFLEKGKTYTADWVIDAADAHFDLNPEGYKQEIKQIKAGEKQQVTMAPGGGFILKLSLEK
jgi:hypothetical protein